MGSIVIYLLLKCTHTNISRRLLNIFLNIFKIVYTEPLKRTDIKGFSPFFFSKITSLQHLCRVNKFNNDSKNRGEG